MPNPVWPAELPQVMEQDGYQESFASQTIATDMDAGPPKVRRRFTAGIKTITGKMRMPEDGVKRLENFFYNDCQGGALPFDWQTQRGYGDQSLVTEWERITDETLLLEKATYMFDPRNPPQVAQIDFQTYEVTLSLWQMPS